MRSVNIKNTKVCAFCKHWYDPTNTAIEPRDGLVNIWKYDEKASKKCIKINLNKPSWATCAKYECKI